MSRLNEVLQYRERLDARKQEAAKAEGALEQSLEMLSHGFGCSNIDAARKALKDLQRKRDKTRQTADAKLVAFEKKWAEHL